MTTEVYLGNPPSYIVQWIKEHVKHEKTWYKYAGDTEWRKVMLGGTIALVDSSQEPTGQIENPFDIVAIEIGTGTQANPVTSIGDNAFYNCTSLTSVVMPNVTSIGENAFYNCRSLTSMAIPDSVTSIGNGAFSGCSGLTSVIIPDSVTSIGNKAFLGCNRLTSVTITANGGNAENVKQMMISAGVSSDIAWNMPN